MVGDNGSTPDPSGDVDEDAEDEIGETADQNFTENQNQGGDQHASEIGARRTNQVDGDQRNVAREITTVDQNSTQYQRAEARDEF